MPDDDTMTGVEGSCGTEEDFDFDAGLEEEIPIDEVFVTDPVKELAEEFAGETQPDGEDTGEGETKKETGETDAGAEMPAELAPAPNILLTPIPAIPPKKTFNFKEPHSRPNRNQLVHHKRLCRKLGIPGDIADQVALLFYGTKKLISLRMRELELMVSFEDIMAVRPGSTTNILRLLHYKTEVGRINAQKNLEILQAALQEGKDIPAAVKTAKSVAARPVIYDVTAGENRIRDPVIKTQPPQRLQMLRNLLGAARRAFCALKGSAKPARSEDKDGNGSGAPGTGVTRCKGQRR